VSGYVIQTCRRRRRRATSNLFHLTTLSSLLIARKFHVSSLAFLLSTVSQRVRLLLFDLGTLRGNYGESPKHIELSPCLTSDVRKRIRKKKKKNSSLKNLMSN
jgi:hypothetical protein